MSTIKSLQLLIKIEGMEAYFKYNFDNISLWFHLFVASYTDVNECMEDTLWCGLGTCINNKNGTFYTCNCNDGTISNGGQASDDSLMCVGRLT